LIAANLWPQPLDVHVNGIAPTEPIPIEGSFVQLQRNSPTVLIDYQQLDSGIIASLHHATVARLTQRNRLFRDHGQAIMS
jgi:hypothetical protein